MGGRDLSESCLTGQDGVRDDESVRQRLRRNFGSGPITLPLDAMGHSGYLAIDGHHPASL